MLCMLPLLLIVSTKFMDNFVFKLLRFSVYINFTDFQFKPNSTLIYFEKLKC